MGLDMYLRAKRFISSKEPQPEIAGLDSSYPVEYITIEVAYWRKANQIHGWFVENIQDGSDNCGLFFVPTSKLQELLELCKQVIAEPSSAEEILPTQDGFFFGPLDYDGWYFDGVAHTVQVLEKALSSLGDEWQFEYTSSW